MSADIDFAAVVEVQARFADAPSDWELIHKTPALVRAVIDAGREPPSNGRTAHLAPLSGRRGIGFQAIGRGPTVVRDAGYAGYAQNISVEACKSLLIDNVVSANAYRDDPSQKWFGNGAYIRDTPAPVVSRSIFAGNGWQPYRPLVERTLGRHGLYIDFGCDGAVVSDCIFSLNCASGCTLRSATTLRRCFFHANSIGAVISMGLASFEDCCWYDGSYYRVLDSHGPAWTGQSAVLAYWPGVLANCDVLGRPGQVEGEAWLRALDMPRRYPNPCLTTAIQHTDPAHPRWRPPKVPPTLHCGGVRISGWPSDATHGSVLQDGPGSLAVRTATASLDVDGPLAEALSGRMSIEATCDHLRSACRTAMVTAVHVEAGLSV